MKSLLEPKKDRASFLSRLLPESQGRLIWGLIIVFVVGVGIMLFALFSLSQEVVKSIAVHNATIYASALSQVRDYYASQVVGRLRDQGIEITHNYHIKEGAIPLPATLSIELGQIITENTEGVQVRLYSDYPFKSRTDGGPHDDFQREALTFLRNHPGDSYQQFETIDGRLSLRYAAPSIMQPSCVECHNSHPDSTKTNWQVGDVRGVLEVVHPISSTIDQVQNRLQLTFLLAVALSLVGLVGLGAVIHRLRQNSTALDQYARDLEQEIIQRKEAEAEKLRLAAIEQELKVAYNLQQSLLPPSQPNWPDLDVRCHSQPARQVGGDFYAYYAFSEAECAHYAVVVGDVTGKGTPAALLMSISLASFRSSIRQAFTPSHLMAHLDQSLADYVIPNQQNCALVYAEFVQDCIYDPNPEWTMRVANAGGIAPLVRRNGGTVEWIDIGGLPLGIGLGAQLGYQTVELQVTSQDLIIFVSDGVIEANNSESEMYGFDRLTEAVIHGPASSADAMLHHLRTEVASFVGATTPHDDITIVVVCV